MEKEYQVEITETLQKIVTVKAENPDEAWKIVRQMYSDEEVILTSEDFMDFDICVLEEIINTEELNEESNDEIVDAE